MRSEGLDSGPHGGRRGRSAGTGKKRPGLDHVREMIRCGDADVLAVWKLDRCSWSVHDFAVLLEELRSQDAGFVSCTESFDTSDPMGEAMVQITMVFAQLERRGRRNGPRRGMPTGRVEVTRSSAGPRLATSGPEMSMAGRRGRWTSMRRLRRWCVERRSCSCPRDRWAMCGGSWASTAMNGGRSPCARGWPPRSSPASVSLMASRSPGRGRRSSMWNPPGDRRRAQRPRPWPWTTGR